VCLQFLKIKWNYVYIYIFFFFFFRYKSEKECRMLEITDSRMRPCAHKTAKGYHSKQVSPRTDSHHYFLSLAPASAIQFDMSFFVGRADLFLPYDIHALRTHSRACRTDVPRVQLPLEVCTTR